MKSRFNKVLVSLAAALCLGVIFLSGCCDDCSVHTSSDSQVDRVLFNTR